MFNTFSKNSSFPVSRPLPILLDLSNQCGEYTLVSSISKSKHISSGSHSSQLKLLMAKFYKTICFTLCLHFLATCHSTLQSVGISSLLF